MKALLALTVLLSVRGARCGCPFSRTSVEYAWAHEAETGKGEGALKSCGTAQTLWRG